MVDFYKKNQAFEKIAAVSSGQVYFFDKQNVKEMVEYLEVAIQGLVQLCHCCRLIGKIFRVCLQKYTLDRAIVSTIERSKAHKVHLLTTKHETGGLRTWDIPFDSELSEVTISITGENRRVKVRFTFFCRKK